ncbi:hypothetical protein SPRG_19892 [Saprolegnia parasitica CBS 223.65]|uniref:TATA-box-binding protein n=1 Tax=Saprolegnia parasitica (strain CBS 223.65) TaxID=695850 RepID=A0A067CR15_SAPPC|nr:hypothetical protein SPRG_19892 [Saprolegnia parasitica CBS 223.65]KDO29222.1 hypothetical protein SPRG_19892 [Saprolegnia parasitica CBS 223.65]|eukprot:XP_012200119.1 hypothetical protein SPRG_19892 [Saprolegnia parasitica CBS 223.65]
MTLARKRSKEKAIERAKAKAEAKAKRELPPQERPMTIANIVGSFHLGVKIDLKELVLKARNVAYNPRRFSGASMRLQDPKATGVFFCSGKVVMLGLTSEEAFRTTASRLLSIVQKIGYTDADIHYLMIHNVTASGCVGYRIRLEGLHNEHYQFSTYEPELFHGLYYRMMEPRVCFIIFVTGTVTACGAESWDDVLEGFEKLLPALEQFRLRPT